VKILSQTDGRCSGPQPINRRIPLPADRWWVVACIDICQRKTDRIKTCQEHSHKGGEVNVMNIESIDPFQDFAGRIGFGGHRANGCLKAAHQHPCRNTMSTHICNDQSMRSITELEEIKIVSTDDLRRTTE